MKLSLDAIELDASIQCRASIDSAVVGEYAERMAAGDTFPPIDVYGSKSKCWIGDGWHRTLGALQCGSESIAATLHSGGRVDALKHALGANALHGQRRTNADKRRCVEIALRELPNLSSRAVAKLCGVSDHTVEACRPSGAQVAHVERTGQDGKQYPARRTADEAQEPVGEEPVLLSAAGEVLDPARELGPPSNGIQFAQMALVHLGRIRKDDVERDVAFESVLAWIADHWKRGELDDRITRQTEVVLHAGSGPVRTTRAES